MHQRTLAYKSTRLIYRQIQTVADYCKYCLSPHTPLAIAQWNRLLPRLAMLRDFESFRLAVSSLTVSMPKTGSIVFNILPSHFVFIELLTVQHFSFMSPSPVLSFLSLTGHCTDPQRRPTHNPPREGVAVSEKKEGKKQKKKKKQQKKKTNKKQKKTTTKNKRDHICRQTGTISRLDN